MTTYTKFKEYIWLVNTIYQAKAITFAEINERWLKKDMSGGVEMARTTFSAISVPLRISLASILTATRRTATDII